MLTDEIRDLARKEGIDVVRFARAEPFEGYLVPGSPRRDPRLSLPTANSIVVVGIYIGGFYLPNWDDPAVGRISRLVLSGFYSDVVDPLGSISSLLRDRGFQALVCDGFESGGSILPLKLAAVRAGVGWQGKNSLAISRQFGSFLALGGIVTDAVLEFDLEREQDRCGGCRACQDACPMGALDEPYRLKRERCLSHLLEGESLSDEVRRLMGNRILECDTCQIVCPWNRKHLARPLDTDRGRAFQESAGKLSELLRLSNLIKLSESEYDDLFGPFRTGVPYQVFRRNVAAALENYRRGDWFPGLQDICAT